MPVIILHTLFQAASFSTFSILIYCVPYLIQGLTQQTLIILVPTAYNGYKEETGNNIYRDLTVVLREATLKL